MATSISIGFGGISVNDTPKPTRENKGKNIIAFPSDYVVIDIETTGLDPKYDEIIEISAIKVTNNTIVDQFVTLVKPENNLEDIDPFIEELTGITKDMLINAPTFSSVSNDFLKFIDDSVLIGHNVNFDINFLYDSTNGMILNDFIDTMRIARRILPDLKHHRLSDIAKHYNINVDVSHRALEDCLVTNSCYISLCDDILDSYETFDNYLSTIKKSHAGVNANDITTDKVDFDKSHPLCNKNCVFTGTLERFARKDAMQIVADLGGICQNNITAKTNFLILGNNDYCPLIKDGKSSKHKKAEALKLQGNDIEIISENVFYDMIFDN